MVTSVEIRAIGERDRAEVAQLLRDLWGDDLVAAHGTAWRPSGLPGFLARDGDEVVGLVTYEVRGDTLEVVTIDALRPAGGVGTGLLDAALTAAREHGCARVRLTTTNDNLDALRFYQRRGFRLVALRPDALAESRRVKPGIPLVGAYGIPLRDELDLECPV
jgi:ribosomal protein S18 acetylase RimI-like enzyme